MRQYCSVFAKIIAIHTFSSWQFMVFITTCYMYMDMYDIVLTGSNW